ncbi:uncharacterized protein LOC114293509 isoform X2 [Camellia sinensis]|uniref:uncharacterized protein LOC114293509 isoform X2 n=1 Tax=Camellia sinensis TaxID=4442 RepID=UPI001035C199|nr:uncharacterized protein LOC114293509 isoform X2 [Camellia sinensis]
MQLYRGKRKALEAIEGNHVASYSKLSKYANEIMKTNPGSLVKIERDRVGPKLDVVMFKRIFISLAAMQKGFKDGCRPFIGVDGCHLKGPYGGVLLAVVALDGDNGLFLLAYAVVECECKESWRFFLYHLRTIIDDGPQSKPWIIMSDGQKSIEPALKEVMPEATHRRCCRHLFNNFKSKFPCLKLRGSFWAAARAYTQKDYNTAMRQIEEVSRPAYKWLNDLKPEVWARHTFDPRVKSDHITSNMVESFNNWIRNIRGKPVIIILESIRTKLMGKLHKRFEKAATWENLVTPTIRKKLDELVFKSRMCKITFAGGDEYQVMEGVTVHIVNLLSRSCCCRVWDISGVPCKHAAACISHRRMNIETFCDQAYQRHKFLGAYGDIIHPIHDESMWDEVPEEALKPPILKRLPGRPPNSRRREVGEATPGASDSRRSCTIKCTICKEIGHNKRTCQRAPVKRKGKSSSISGSSVSTARQTSGVAMSQESRKGSSLGSGISIRESNAGGNCTSNSRGSGHGIPTGRGASGRGSTSTVVGGQHDEGQPGVQSSKWSMS